MNREKHTFVANFLEGKSMVKKQADYNLIRVLFVVVIALIFSPMNHIEGHQEDQHDHSHQGHDHSDHAHTQSPCASIHDDHHDADYDPGATALHHISDANTYKLTFFVKEWNLPLPCFLYAPEDGWSVFSSSRFGIGHHGDGHKTHDKYVLEGAIVKRIADASFPKGTVEIDGFVHEEVEKDGKKKSVSYVCYQGNTYLLDQKSTLDGGLLGGGITSFYDFSLTRNVVTMIWVVLLLLWLFTKAAKAYKKRDGMAPKGVQNFLEPLFLFIQEEVAKPMIGKKYERFMPFIMCLFFFILTLNMIGQIPFFGNPNVTGNIGVTIVLAVLTFILTNINANAHYWKHIFWMPGIPVPVKLILAPVEILGLFLKPLTLLIRLFANISAGHIVMLSFIGLIFILGDSGRNVGASWGGVMASAVLTAFMSAIELLVALIQAFIFAILSASYIGAAVADDHH